MSVHMGRPTGEPLMRYRNYRQGRILAAKTDHNKINTNHRRPSPFCAWPGLSKRAHVCASVCVLYVLYGENLKTGKPWPHSTSIQLGCNFGHRTSNHLLPPPNREGGKVTGFAFNRCCLRDHIEHNRVACVATKHKFKLVHTHTHTHYCSVAA